MAVTDITGVFTSITTTLKLGRVIRGTVVPSDATNQTISWSVKDAGTTGATITGNPTFNATAPGTVVVTATVVNGASTTTNYVQDFNITVVRGNVIPQTGDSFNLLLRIILVILVQGIGIAGIVFWIKQRHRWV